MKKLLLLLFLLCLQSSFAQSPMPKFQGGDLQNFYDFINTNFDRSKSINNEEIKCSFTLDSVGKMKEIKLISFKEKDAAFELLRVLKSADNWDVSNQDIKYKIIIESNIFIVKGDKIRGTTKTKWFKRNDDVTEEQNTKVIEEKAYEINTVEVKPEYKGGLSKFYQFIAKNFRTPFTYDGFKGRVLVSFVIEKDGSLTEIKVLKDAGYNTAAEAIRVLSKSPKWSPAIQRGIPVRCYYVLPIVLVSNE
ncbi:energy transducer TonB [Flavobacterium sp. SUN046]|uniref:energy transducer TonB n=1 Tax=Flavobacterium sp. SUN046 TaxID=3002440 RepID=UPI002DB566C9|nr:energy transducer TonB [Flavobacterium sp. SUN046]MEC4050565.1 energy transducer TonB [Flavobacterium sp. SUN046]